MYTTRCNGTTESKISLKVDGGAENGTVVSIFCPVNGKETLLFNVGICKFIFKITTMTIITLCILVTCDENARLVNNGECRCTEGFVGDGTQCEDKGIYHYIT